MVSLRRLTLVAMTGWYKTTRKAMSRGWFERYVEVGFSGHFVRVMRCSIYIYQIDIWNDVLVVLPVHAYVVVISIGQVLDSSIFIQTFFFVWYCKFFLRVRGKLRNDWLDAYSSNVRFILAEACLQCVVPSYKPCNKCISMIFDGHEHWKQRIGSPILVCSSHDITLISFALTSPPLQ